ncbi:aminotransferase class V-fold PLP-dependent enzyme [Solirubrobacter sp. CPCC 204708]|uniref:Aminotransferase class V-fold PLP-dependent enzyme n=1 Tax=Solirubrobacter deserti TaxID=2282478 RepID=A0ABT4RQ84_9ACTN|nr:aminotransferase class V-fold PLP-dependent enzyme [Solirubrobacter deserti]MBE2320487.1 aminotransferase class V-fold PLP-dependent enzyme [Solirubrobacter deserti]MDA0140733.1 aminotransferase class V-fold PLP-dependent enzyme [Solirubrobacter deserti]
MSVTRKELLAGGAALALVGCGEKKSAGPAFFALDPRWRHFDAFLFAAHPKPVRDAIERHRRGLDAGAADYLRRHEAELDEAVAVAGARYLGVQPGTLAFVDSTTMGLALTYRGLLQPGDEVLTTEHDHYATHESLRLSGATVRRVRLYDDPAQASADAMIGALRGALTERTKVVALTWVHSGTGVKLPLMKLRAALGNAVTLVVDAVHALGVEPDPIDIHLCDVLVAGTHKWLGGPRGTGLIWSIKAWDKMAPVIPSFGREPYGAWLQGEPVGPVEADRVGELFTPGGYHSFEHRWALAQAFDWQHGLGRAHVAERTHGLAERLKDGLARLSHVRLVTPRSREVSSGIVCFDVAGMRPDQVVDRLGRRRIRASVTPYAEQHVRLGTSLHVDAKDVDAAVSAVKSLRG